MIVRADLLGLLADGRADVAGGEQLTTPTPAEAAVILKDCRDQLAKLGELELAAIAGAYLAKSYASLGRLDDAIEAAERAGERSAADVGSARRGTGSAHRSTDRCGVR